MSVGQHRRRVGAVRPSHLMFTSGVGALVDLPNFSVLVRGLDDWSDQDVDLEAIAEPRLLAAVRMLPGMGSVAQLRPAPWRDGIDADPKGPASRVGVPVTPFPAWLRCTACDELAPVTTSVFSFENDRPRRPHDARFFHGECPKSRRRPLAVAARFILTCTNGHLDDFPYRHFVHHGGACPKAPVPRLRMEDRGGNLGANVEILCINCGAKRNIREALGKRGQQNLPSCRGRHAHLSWFDPDGCQTEPKVLVVGASNQWFSMTLAALVVPRTGASELATLVEQLWMNLEGIPDKAFLPYARSNVPKVAAFERWSDDELWDAIVAFRESADDEQEQELGYPDLRTAEWEIFSAAQLPPASDDFTLHRPGVPADLKGFVADIVQAERLREVRALVGFTRLDAPDPDDPDLVTTAPLTRAAHPEWVPASEVRGEGIFLRLPEDLLSAWEERVHGSTSLRAHEQAYARFRQNRYSDRIKGAFEPMKHWPGARYIAMHSLSHLLIRTIALECGYSSASLSERIYAGHDNDPRSGILIYTAVPDAEGTLGGLVSLGAERELTRLIRRALSDAMRCSSDPLCAERLPVAPADFLHGAACHVCMFVSETTCERGNRFLDRRFVAPIDESGLALYPELP
ncbi:MAG: DrmB family protein [Pseudonocardia sp.]